MTQEKYDRSAAEVVKTFYDEYGWRRTGERSGEDNLFRAFPERYYQTYAPANQARLFKLFDGRAGDLLLVGCGDLPATHERLAGRFARTTCMDISTVALEEARAKLGEAGVYRLDSIVETSAPDNIADVIFCAHVVYHIDKDQQAAAVRQMIRLTRPGGRIVIFYANPRSLFALPGEAMRTIDKLREKTNRIAGAPPPLYYHAHPLSWWDQFADAAKITLAPGEVIGSRPARAMLHGRTIAGAFYGAADWMEDNSPRLAARVWQYPLIVLDVTKA